MESLECIYDAARKQVGKISTVKYLKRVYDLSTTADRKRKAEDPMLVVQSGAVYGLSKFVKKYKIADAELTKIANSPPQPMMYYEEPRRSGRVSTSPITTQSCIEDPWKYSIDVFTCLPPQGAREWTLETLVLFVDNLTTSGQKCLPFLKNIVARGKSKYTSVNSIQKMYRKWKIPGDLRGVRRPSIISVE